MSKFKEVKITSEYITLGQFLKFADIIANGGDAEHDIFVNGTACKMRGKKLYASDQIVIDDSLFFEIGK